MQLNRHNVHTVCSSVYAFLDINIPYIVFKFTIHNTNYFTFIVNACQCQTLSGSTVCNSEVSFYRSTLSHYQ